MNRIQADPRFGDFVFLEELARKLLRENQAYRADRAAFHVAIYHRQVARESALKDKPFITDRGTADAFAFHPETRDDVGTTLAAEYARYTSVIQLESSAALGEEYYSGDEVRREPIDDALAIEQAIREVWKGHPDYHFIRANRDMEAKLKRIIEVLDGCVKRTT